MDTFKAVQETSLLDELLALFDKSDRVINALILFIGNFGSTDTGLTQLLEWPGFTRFCSLKGELVSDRKLLYYQCVSMLFLPLYIHYFILFKWSCENRNKYRKSL